jgi:hypothetical protein
MRAPDSAMVLISSTLVVGLKLSGYQATGLKLANRTIRLELISVRVAQGSLSKL